MTESTEAAQPSRGRPRSEASHAAVLAAAFDLLVERGYAAMAVEAVAAQAGVGKATIYRWWPNRAELAVEAFFSATLDQLGFPDTESAREDFRLQVHQVAALLRGRSGVAMAAMIAGALTEPALAQALGQRWVAPRMRWGVERMRRAQAAGEAPADLDVSAALAALCSPLYARLSFGLDALTEAEVEAYAAIVLHGTFGPLTRG